ncbi:MAG: hypothetical protein KH704_09320 [Clostridiales bacterium]|nr:hypothetical protein [Clostridiales bacterium]
MSYASTESHPSGWLSACACLEKEERKRAPCFFLAANAIGLVLLAGAAAIFAAF